MDQAFAFEIFELIGLTSRVRVDEDCFNVVSSASIENVDCCLYLLVRPSSLLSGRTYCQARPSRQKKNRQNKKGEKCEKKKE